MIPEHLAQGSVTSLGSFTEQGLAELEQHLAGQPVDAKRISGTLGLAGITGQVDSTGAITAGTGFTVNKTGTGTYVVTFTTAFSAAPTVIATAMLSGASLDRVALVNSTSTTAVEIDVSTLNALAANGGFHFVAFATV